MNQAEFVPAPDYFAAKDRFVKGDTALKVDDSKDNVVDVLNE